MREILEDNFLSPGHTFALSDEWYQGSQANTIDFETGSQLDRETGRPL